MNNKISASIGFVFGVGAGFAGCYAFFKKKNESAIEAKVESLKNTYEKLNNAAPAENKPDDIREQKIDNTISGSASSVIKKVSNKKEAVDETDEDSEDSDDEDYDDYETDDSYISTYYEDVVKSYKSDDPIQLITEPEYADTTNGYDKLEFTYYGGDEEHVIDVDTGHEVDNWMSLLGYDDGLLNDELFEEYGGVVYIRNNAMCTDYMVTKTSAAFN